MTELCLNYRKWPLNPVMPVPEVVEEEEQEEEEVLLESLDLSL